MYHFNPNNLLEIKALFSFREILNIKNNVIMLN